jgi:hypothetical protein
MNKKSPSIFPSLKSQPPLKGCFKYSQLVGWGRDEEANVKALSEASSDNCANQLFRLYPNSGAEVI